MQAKVSRANFTMFFMGLDWVGYLASAAKIAALHSADVGGLPSFRARRFQRVFGFALVTVNVIFIGF
jgi:hypothetical protein